MAQIINKTKGQLDYNPRNYSQDLKIGRDASGLRHRLIWEIATENGANFNDVAAIVYSQFKFIADTMHYSGFESVRLPYLGKFSVHPYRVQKINEAICRIRAKANERTV